MPVKTVPEFIAYAKANPGKLSYASGGTGSSLHVISELFKMMAGIDMVHVPYRGGAPAMIDLLGGRVQVMFDTIPQAIDYIRDGKLRALAVTTATRSEVLPNVPAMSDFVPGFQAGSWWGLAAPKDTPHNRPPPQLRNERGSLGSRNEDQARRIGDHAVTLRSSPIRELRGDGNRQVGEGAEVLGTKED